MSECKTPGCVDGHHILISIDDEIGDYRARFPTRWRPRTPAWM